MTSRKSAGQRVGVGSVAIYARISSDAEGTGLGVARQLEDCRKLAADRGWPVGAEYVDNDVSAFSGKPRREYARMLADLASGDRDAVIVYNLDPLYPETSGVPTTGSHSPVAAPSSGQALSPRYSSRRPGLEITRHHRGFTCVHPSGLPVARLLPRTEQGPLGFYPGLRTPTDKTRRRTPGRGSIWNTDRELRLRHDRPPICEFTRHARLRVAREDFLYWYQGLRGVVRSSRRIQPRRFMTLFARMPWAPRAGCGGFKLARWLSVGGLRGCVPAFP
jgi:hypothetical protein